MKKIYVVLTGVFIILCALLITTCNMEPSGGEIIRVPGGAFVRPGVLHIQSDFIAMRKLMDRWQGIERVWDDPYNPYRSRIVRDDLTPIIPVGPVGAEQSPQSFVESQRAGNSFFSDPHESPVAPEAIAEFRERRAADRRMFAEYRAHQAFNAFWGSADSNFTGDWVSPMFEFIGRDGVVAGTTGRVQEDIRRAYLNGVRWMITGDKRHAQRAFTILDSYARSLRGFQHGGFYDHVLMVGLQGQLIAAAADIIRFGRDVVNGETSGFIPEQFYFIDRSLREVWLGTLIRDYVNIPPWRAGNQSSMAEAAYIALAIYLGDVALFEHAINFILHAPSTGNIIDYIHRFTGQMGEATRSQNYPFLAIGKMAISAEMAWRQGVDLYSAHDNAIWRAAEFASRFNLGDNNVQSSNPMLFDPHAPTFFFDDAWDSPWYGHSHRLTTANRGYNFRAGDIIWNHYVRRRGMEMPWTEAYKPRSGDPSWHAADSPPGFTSFLYVAYELARELGL